MKCPKCGGEMARLDIRFRLWQCEECGYKEEITI